MLRALALVLVLLISGLVSGAEAPAPAAPERDARSLLLAALPPGAPLGAAAPAPATAASAQSYVSAVAVGADVDGDGAPDPLHVLRVAGLPVLEARAARDGAALWSAPHAAPFRSLSERSYDWIDPIGDADGDGAGDALVSTWRYEEPGSLGSYWVVRSWHTVVSGASGAVLWSVAETGSAPTTPLGSQLFPYADVDGDGAPDLLHLSWSTVLNQGDTLQRARVLRGTDGAVLRERLDVVPLGIGPNPAAVGDVTGDAQPDLVLLDVGATLDLVVEDGRTGMQVWRATLTEAVRGVWVVATLSPDGAPGVLLDATTEGLAGGDDFAVAYSADGARLWASAPTPYYQYTIPAGDATGDGRSESYAIGYDVFGDLHDVALLDGATGGRIGVADPTLGWPYALLELTGDGALDLALVAGSGHLVLDAAQGLAPVASVGTDGYLCDGTGDVTGDGRPDGVFRAVTGAWWDDEPLVTSLTLFEGSSWELTWTNELAAYGSAGCPLLLDATGDGRADLLTYHVVEGDGVLRAMQRVVDADGADVYAIEIAAFAP